MYPKNGVYCSYKNSNNPDCSVVKISGSDTMRTCMYCAETDTCSAKEGEAEGAMNGAADGDPVGFHVGWWVVGVIDG